jgi:hypothetical protein
MIKSKERYVDFTPKGKKGSGRKAFMEIGGKRKDQKRNPRRTHKKEKKTMDKTPFWKIALLYIALKADQVIKKIKGIFK